MVFHARRTKFSALLPYGPCCYRYSATRPAARCQELTQRCAAKRCCDFTRYEFTAPSSFTLASTFFFGLTWSKQPSTIGRPVQRQPTGSVHSLIFLPCTLLPRYDGNLELPVPGSPPGTVDCYTVTLSHCYTVTLFLVENHRGVPCLQCAAQKNIEYFHLPWSWSGKPRVFLDSLKIWQIKKPEHLTSIEVKRSGFEVAFQWLFRGCSPN